ncbi:MAG: ABC transporter permease, partial [Devosiaceae bacterium]
MSVIDPHPDQSDEAPALVRIGRFMGAYPVIPLIILLGLLIGTLEIMRPGIISPFWANNTIKFAIPLAMLAACQMLTMLTAGIDLSAAVVATVSAFVVASITPLYGPVSGVAIALGAAMLVGVVNGFGVGVARVHP